MFRNGYKGMQVIENFPKILMTFNQICLIKFQHEGYK